MWGDEALARLDGEEGEQDDQQAQQEPLSGSDDPAAEEPGGNEPPILKDYWEQRGLFIHRVHEVPRTMRFAPTLCDEEPPIPLANIEVYRTTIPDKFYQIPKEEDTWIGHKKDEQVFRRNANGSPLSWTGETRFERVLTTGTWKQGRFDWVMVRPGNPARFQAGRYSRRTPDTSVEVWNAYSELQKLEDIVEYDKVRAPRYAHARANRTLPREPYQDPLVPLLCVSEPDGSASGCVTDASMPSMHSCGSESGEQSEGADPSIDFCDLCNKPAWFQKYKMDKKANKCKSMFCGFVRNK
jgi:hypothetical protein